MMKYRFLLFYLLLLGPVLSADGQKLVSNSSVTGVCYAGTQVTKIYIPPPAEFFKNAGRKGGGSVTIYYTGFSAQAKAALEYAASILKSMLPADTRLTVTATWEKISTAGILGQSTITGYIGGWGIDALNPYAIYPVSLAEKIAGRKLNNDLQGDLQLVINSSQPWYLGTDGQTPVGKFDLVTVALHEICHGLGFYDSFNVSGNTASYGFSSIPVIYDTFIESSSGNRLTDTLKFENPSASLKYQVTSDQIYFRGPLLTKYCVLNNLSLAKAKLWAPSVFDAGSSVSHLDENKTLQANALMTPNINYGEAIHNPGKFTFSILGDLGWINTRIIHKPLIATERHLSEVALSAQIKSDTLYNKNRVGVVFSFNNFVSSDTVFMQSPGSDDNFRTTLTIPSYNSELQYYFFVEDCFLRLYRSPSAIDLFRYKTYIGTDTVKPVITHTPVNYYLEAVDSIKFSATATDDLGVDSVYAEYRVNDGISRYVGLRGKGNDSYAASFKARFLALKGGDSIRYRILAIDSAHNANTAVLPKSGYFITHIEDIKSVVESYSTDFSNSAADFFNNGFSVQKPKDFNRYGLHTKHPYESPEDNDKSIDYTAMLRHPVRLGESGFLINFSEVVLVEPGEPGSVFGSPDFYDYVIVEGSDNFGKEWFSLAPGYDSRWSSLWESSYNSAIIGQNSVYPGSESLLKNHTIYVQPSDNLAAGDSLLIRFRLYSDPFANGWGWVIEDLKINPLIDAIEKKPEDNQVNLYPNPGAGLIRIGIKPGDIYTGKQLKYSVFNSAGICLVKDQLFEGAEYIIDISGYPSGMYIIILNYGNYVKSIRYSMIK